jgi:hypothetical protein
MPFIEIQPDFEVRGHWDIYVEQIKHHHHEWREKLEKVEIEKVWVDRVNHHEWVYQFQCKSGHFPHHHHFTVLAETRHGHHKILNIVEGHDTLF